MQLEHSIIFTVTFDEFDVSLLNESTSFCRKKMTPDFWTVVY